MYCELKVRNNVYYFILHFIYKDISEINEMCYRAHCILDPNYREFILFVLILALVNRLEMRGEMIPKGSKFRWWDNLEKRKSKEWAEVQHISCRPFQRISGRPLRKNYRTNWGHDADTCDQ